MRWPAAGATSSSVTIDASHSSLISSSAPITSAGAVAPYRMYGAGELSALKNPENGPGTPTRLRT